MKCIPSLEQQTAMHTKQSDSIMYRRGFSRGLALGLILLAGFIVLTGSLLYGEGSDDALYIDQNGNVGNGKKPENGITLDVNGIVKVREIMSAGKVKAKKFEGDGSDLTVNGKSIELFLVPRGAIIAWFPKAEDRQGNRVKVPDGWAICDGKKGTPDLTNRFIRGTNNAKSIASAGGKSKHNHRGTTQRPKLIVKKEESAVLHGHGGIGGSSHQHEFLTLAESNLPPYLDLVYIMKL